MFESSRTLALVVEGGGLRGAFSAGVLGAWATSASRLPDYVYAASSGAPSAAFLVAQQMDSAIRIWEDHTHAGQLVAIRHLLRGRPLMDIDKLVAHFQSCGGLDPARLAHSTSQVFVAVTDCRSGAAHYPRLSPENTFEVLRATMALPLIYGRTVEIAGRSYVDGGIADSIPIEPALEVGADNIVVVLTQPSGYAKRRSRWAELLVRSQYSRFPELVDAYCQRAERYNRCLERIATLEAAGRIAVIRPHTALPASRLTRDRGRILATLQQGREAGMEWIRRVGALALVCVAGVRATGCRCEGASEQQSIDATAVVAPVSVSSQEVPHELPVRRGMVWIPPGALVAGTPPERVPRKADQEIPGEQIVLAGFFIDQFAFPNESGAIPLTNVTQEQARAKCTGEGKRLCSELEWERACKGPQNFTYEYGDHYRAELCGTGAPARPLPSGYRFGCRSELGVQDLHGATWEWTDSPWGRGKSGGLVALRGGNDVEGEVVGRCANGRPSSPSSRSDGVSFRCCSGARNPVEVDLAADPEASLGLRSALDRELTLALQSALPEEALQELKPFGVFRISHLWTWKPVSNENLAVAGGCAGDLPRRRCGVLVARRTLGRLDGVVWVGSGIFFPTLKLKGSLRRIWVYGGDQRSHFRRYISFEWGRFVVGSPEVPEAKAQGAR